MVNHHCCAVDCTADTRKKRNLIKYPWMENVKFFPFPVEISGRRKWLKLIRRQDLTLDKITRHTRICSLHWENDGMGTTHEHPSPTLFAYNSYKSATVRQSSVNHQTKRVNTDSVIMEENCVEVVSEIDNDCIQVESDIGDDSLIIRNTRVPTSHPADDINVMHQVAVNMSALV